jgi:Na+/phosphate symporter
MQERAAAAAAATVTRMNATAESGSVRSAGASSSPKQDYLEQQRRLEEEIARYDQEIKASGKRGKEEWRSLEFTCIVVGSTLN